MANKPASSMDRNESKVRHFWESLGAKDAAADLRVKTHTLHVGDGVAHGVWEAWYTFTATGRSVHNKITTRLVLRDGLIVDHHDRFPFYKWSRQALGAKGWLLGWTPLVRVAVRKQARKRLDKWMANQ